jgi:thiosulfate/3-mercaptopyruvate sulfurtransferase
VAYFVGGFLRLLIFCGLARIAFRNATCLIDNGNKSYKSGLNGEAMRHRLLVAMILFTAITAHAAAPSLRNSQRPVHMLVQTSWLAAHLSDKNLVILHVGANRAGYDAGHIPGARFLALNEIAVRRGGIAYNLPETKQLKMTFERLGVGDHSHVVLYGDMLNLFALRAYVELDYLGHGSNVSLLDGGLDKWAKEHGTVRTVPGNIAPAVLTMHPNAALIAQLPEVRKVVSNKSIHLIDARSPAEYMGTNSGYGGARTGHIPSAKNVFWEDNLVSEKNPVYKPVPEIRARYLAAGVKPGDKVIVYCQAGIHAAYDYFALELMGARPVLYTGSFGEWSNEFNAPIEKGSGRSSR